MSRPSFTFGSSASGERRLTTAERLVAYIRNKHEQMGEAWLTEQNGQPYRWHQNFRSTLYPDAVITVSFKAEEDGSLGMPSSIGVSVEQTPGEHYPALAPAIARNFPNVIFFNPQGDFKLVDVNTDAVRRFTMGEPL